MDMKLGALWVGNYHSRQFMKASSSSPELVSGLKKNAVVHDFL